MTAPALESFVALSEVQARVALAMDDVLGAWHGLAWADFVLLHALQRAPGGTMSLSRLAAQQGLAPSALLRRLLPMEKTGWIERQGGQLALRPAGDRLVREAAASADVAARRALRDLPAPEWQRLRPLLMPMAPAAASAEETPP